MISNDRAYVWIFLPDSLEPVVAGLIQKIDDKYLFTYGQSYLKRENAISIFPDELPLQAGTMKPKWELASSLRDASPDAWGRRVILHRLANQKKSAKEEYPDELTFLLNSGSDRIGALDFQESPEEYIPREQANISLDELFYAVEKIEKGKKLSSELELALLHGTSIGGARPKVMINKGNKKFIAKFSSSSDYYNVIKAEYIAMRLAFFCGINTAPVSLTKAADKDVLLIERFDREYKKKNWFRKPVISALTMLGLNEMEARYASYEDFAVYIRHHFKEPKKTLRELFTRMVFNILVGNTDDHARNHAAFWNGKEYELTPAYDICPQARSGQIASQAMKINGQVSESKLIHCVQSSPSYLLKEEEAVELIQHIVKTISEQWDSVCKEAHLSKSDKNYFMGNQFLNPFAFQDF